MFGTLAPPSTLPLLPGKKVKAYQKHWNRVAPVSISVERVTMITHPRDCKLVSTVRLEKSWYTSTGKGAGETEREIEKERDRERSREKAVWYRGC